MNRDAAGRGSDPADAAHRVVEPGRNTARKSPFVARCAETVGERWQVQWT